MEWTDWLFDLSIYSTKMQHHIEDEVMLFRLIALVVIFIVSIDRKSDLFINILIGLSLGISVLFPGFYDLLLVLIESTFEIKVSSFFYSSLMNTFLYHFILIPILFIFFYIFTFRFLNIKKDLGYR